MSIQRPGDLIGMRDAGRVVHRTLADLEQHVRVGVTTAALDRLAGAILASQHAHSAPALIYGFPGNVLISVNDEVVHGVPGARRLEPGDLVKLDVTIEKNGYIADGARSIIIGPGTDVARRLVQCVRRAFDAATAVACAGTRVNEIGRAIEHEVRRHRFTAVQGLAGHGVGHTIHEEPSVPNEYNPSQQDILTEGLVLTIEPLVSAGAPQITHDRNGWTIRTRDGSLSSHYENTVMITKQRPLVLTAA